MVSFGYECGVCGAEFDDQMSLAEHIRENHPNVDVGDFECSVCGARFETKEELYAHLKGAHPG